MDLDAYRIAEERLSDARGSYELACEAARHGDPWAEAEMKVALYEIRWALWDIEALEEQERIQCG